MSKLEKNVDFYCRNTGEELSLNNVEKLMKDDFSNKLKIIYNKIYNGKLDELSLNDLETIMKIEKRSTSVSIDFKENEGSFFIIKENRRLCKDLTMQTKSVLYEIQQSITHDNTIVTLNNRPISSYKDLCDYIGISYSIWKRHISKDNSKYKIIRKEPINGKSYLVLNPLFSVKSRNITEYTFKCFYDILKEYLHPIDYLYLVKLYGIDPSNTYIRTKQEKNKLEAK